jgi:ketosteroid isomerase-like protein
MHDLPDTAAWIDRYSIRDLIDRYTDAINRQEWTALHDLFTPSAVWQASEPFAVRFEGREAVVGALRNMVSSHEFVVQHNGAVVIDLNGAHARARVSLSELGRKPTGEGLHVFGMYLDDLLESNGVWRFERRTFHCRYFDGPVVAGRVFSIPAV